MVAGKLLICINNDIFLSITTAINTRSHPAGKETARSYGDRRVCLRYRDDAPRKRHLKSLELISKETDWQLPSAPSGRREVGSQAVHLTYDITGWWNES